MADLRFEFEWADPLTAQGRELRATWARLVIWAGDRCVTRVLDHDSKTIREGVYLPLYPLAEWLATRWWNVLAEVPTPERLGDDSFQDRHSLRSGRDGYALPPALLTATGDRVRLQWFREVAPNYRVEFIDEGTLHLPLDEFIDAASSFVSAVTARLEAHDIVDTLLQQEWAALNALSESEREFCSFAAALGLDPFALDRGTGGQIIEAAESLPTTLRRDFISVATPYHLGAEAGDVLSAYAAAQENAGTELTSLTGLRHEFKRDLVLPTLEPWKRGYADAQRLRAIVGASTEPLSSFDAIAKILAVSKQALERSILERVSSTRIYDALVADTGNSPSFVVSRRHANPSRRFHFSRGLYAYMAAGDNGPWLVTKSLSEWQKQTRAFAAEFLAPAAALRERMTASTVSREDVDDVASEFGVSPHVIFHQLENHGIATVL